MLFLELGKQTDNVLIIFEGCKGDDTHGVIT
jgi:hypothetical protein